VIKKNDTKEPVKLIGTIIEKHKTHNKK